MADLLELNFYKLGSWLRPKFKRFERIILLLIVVGVSLLYFTPSHNGVVFNLGLALLALLYFFRGFMPLEGDTVNKTDAFANKFLYWGLSTLIVGIQFRVLDFPGYETQLSLGSFITTVSLIFCIFWLSKHKEKRANYMPFVYRGIILLSLGLLLYSIPSKELEELHIIKEHSIETEVVE